jgi:hypothetical protein
VKLSEFLNQLFNAGIVTVPREMVSFQDADLAISAQLIRQFYESDKLEMSHEVPMFDQDAALWAVQYLFHAVQLVQLRELGDDVIDQYLRPYPGEYTPSSIYSVDLLFRYLAPLFKFSSGISPDDPLVNRLHRTAAAWPFSSVGLNITGLANTSMIFSSLSLKYTYMDRIVLHRDVSRLTGPVEIILLQEILGLHQAQLWPGLELLVTPT